MEEKSMKKLVIDDLPGDTVEELLKYIYTDSSHNVELFSQTLLAASDRYKLPGLKHHCEKHLGEIMNPLNVSDILLLSENYSCKELKRSALTYCGENHSYIIKDSKWKTMEKENPQLFAEAVALVAPESCDKHAECLKKGGNRYEVEKSSKGSVGGRKKSYVRKL
ncbi:speckle-type POZ protein-like B [Eurytemora carolleeae]|uniref:speckle-type POZ protein-like B n=1 Tax=Eurytemora carolleeae TaxID=1294199 RepID=UPI000C757AAD|nr:speckle-type POZ protein-like B [Eurytemora carolleeae]|eukprot:XP_023332541.1 speckle-type POZ protein-like B [Eurytemora affinis]